MFLHCLFTNAIGDGFQQVPTGLQFVNGWDLWYAVQHVLQYLCWHVSGIPSPKTSPNNADSVRNQEILTIDPPKKRQTNSEVCTGTISRRSFSIIETPQNLTWCFHPWEIWPKKLATKVHVLLQPRHQWYGPDPQKNIPAASLGEVAVLSKGSNLCLDSYALQDLLRSEVLSFLSAKRSNVPTGMLLSTLNKLMFVYASSKCLNMYKYCTFLGKPKKKSCICRIVSSHQRSVLLVMKRKRFSKWFRFDLHWGGLSSDQLWRSEVPPCLPRKHWTCQWHWNRHPHTQPPNPWQIGPAESFLPQVLSWRNVYYWKIPPSRHSSTWPSCCHLICSVHRTIKLIICLWFTY